MVKNRYDISELWLWKVFVKKRKSVQRFMGCILFRIGKRTKDLKHAVVMILGTTGIVPMRMMGCTYGIAEGMRESMHSLHDHLFRRSKEIRH